MSLLAVASAAIIPGCRVHAPANARPSGGLIPGTYTIQLCQGSCDAGENVVAEGHLVVEAARYSADEIPRVARDYFRRYTAALLLGDAGGSPNACFALDRKRSHPRTFAGQRPAGLTLAEIYEGDSVSITLFRSPDASHHIIVKPTGKELRGRGVSSGIADAADAYADDSVLARRIGPPDRSHCIRAAERAASELARPPTSR